MDRLHLLDPVRRVFAILDGFAKYTVIEVGGHDGSLGMVITEARKYVRKGQQLKSQWLGKNDVIDLMNSGKFEDGKKILVTYALEGEKDE